MAGFMESPIVLRITLFIGLVACLLQVVGMACPNWLEIQGRYQGLWQYCVIGTCRELPEVAVADWFKGVRAMEVVGFLTILGAIAGIASSIFFPTESTKKSFKVLAIVASFAATAFILIGVIIFVVKLNESSIVSITQYLSWAFGLCIAAAILSGLNGILVILSINL